MFVRREGTFDVLGSQRFDSCRCVVYQNEACLSSGLQPGMLHATVKGELTRKQNIEKLYASEICNWCFG